MDLERVTPANRPDTPPSAGEADRAAPPPSEGRRRPPVVKRLILLLLLIGALTAAGSFGWHWWTVGRFEVSTDDAYVAADFAIVAPKISGYVAEILAVEDRPVRAGDPLIRLDDGDYRVALRATEAAITAQKAAISRLSGEIDQAMAGIDAARAGIGAARAAIVQATSDFRRYQDLATSDYASKQKLESARAALDTARATLDAREAALAEAEAALVVAGASHAEAEAEQAVKQATRDRAVRDLEATVIRAPFDGVVGNLAVAAGDFVQPGKRLLAVVPLDRIYIDANFKETQLTHLTTGAPVDIHVDAYPDRNVIGHIIGFAPATGSVFSLLPAENATGNFTKIVQRLPVRISVPETVAAEGWLRPGMSVVVTTDMRDAPDHQDTPGATR